MAFVFYDFETTGTSPPFDQPTQFAAILTDDGLNPQERIDIRCRLSPHILPAPWALAVTGVTPEILTDTELPSWFEFVQTLSGLVDQWGPATWTGYNSLAFDEEMLRQSLYQNLHPSPYLTQMDGNDRLDIMKLVYSVWVLAPDAFNWPTDDNGRQSFKLDRLAPANGFENHDAHDALGDVEATIHIARLIRDRAPAVWEQSLRNRSKQEVAGLLETGQPLRLIERFGAAPPRSYIGAFAGRNADNPNSVGFLDLELVDPVDLAAQDDQAIAAAVSATPKLIRTLATNKVPSLFPLDGTSPEVTGRAEALATMSDFHIRVGQALAGRFADREESEYVEEQIYSGFFTNADQQRMRQFQGASWSERLGLAGEFGDGRLRALGLRAIYLNAPDLLDDAIRGELAAAIQERWNSNEPDAPWTTFSGVEQQLQEITDQEALDGNQMAVLRGFYQSLRA